MLFRRLLQKQGTAGRSISTSAVALAHDTRGIVGSNLPFQIENKFRLGAVAVLFVGSGLALPFFLLRHALLRKRGD